MLPAAFDAKTLPFEILDPADAAVLADDVLRREMRAFSVAVLVGEDAQIGHAGILDGKREGRIAERRHVDLARGERIDEKRAALKARRLEHVGFSFVLGDAAHRKEDRRDLRRHEQPSHANLHRLRRPRRRDGERERQKKSGRHPQGGGRHALSIHFSSP